MKSATTEGNAMKALTNQTDEQVRAEAYESYRNMPTHILHSVVRVNAGTVVREKYLTAEVARDILKERGE